MPFSYTLVEVHFVKCVECTLCSVKVLVKCFSVTVLHFAVSCERSKRNLKILPSYLTSHISHTSPAVVVH
jgi:hypothetical protein